MSAHAGPLTVRPEPCDHELSVADTCRPSNKPGLANDFAASGS